MISIEGLNGVSQLKKQCDLGKVLLDTMNSQKFDLKDGDTSGIVPHTIIHC